MNVFLSTGCQFHGCVRPNCSIISNPSRETINCIGRKHGDLQDEWAEKMKSFMLQYGPNGQGLVNEFLIIFECEWRERKRTDERVVDFMVNR